MLRKLSDCWSAFRSWPAPVRWGLPLAVGFVVLLAWPRPAHAGERIARKGADEVRLFDSPCLYAGVLQHIQPERRSAFGKATARIDGKGYFACWVRDDQGAVWLVYEDADVGILPWAQFKDVPSA